MSNLAARPVGERVDERPVAQRSPRQARTVERLCAAAVDEIRSEGYERLTVRNVARRAGVAAATAYNYFASKDHLVAEVFWRRLAALAPPTVDRRAGRARRAGQALRDVALLVADEPELSAACTSALMAGDAEVRRLRERIGGAIRARVVTALGDDADPPAVRALELAFAGAMVQTGTGHLSYGELPGRLAEVAELVLGGRKP
ncbi:MAG: TetR family transcriptional regulator [Actinobacteria bacterium]|nr:TetR family transcriptional regulator [Actinomycetota bacterium]